MKRYLRMTEEERFEDFFEFINDEVPWLVGEWLDYMEEEE